MLALEESPEAAKLIETTLIAWVAQYQKFEMIDSLEQLTDGVFFLEALEEVKNFKLLEPIIDPPQQPSLANKVTIIKTIMKSLIKFHQKIMLRNISGIDINCVELCMGNKNEIIKLVTLILSALNSSPSSRESLFQKIEQMDMEGAEMMHILIENTMGIGQSCDSSSSQQWKLSSQKKVYAKMEELEHKVDQLESANKKLQEGIKFQRQIQLCLEKENNNLKEKMIVLAERNIELEDLNEATNSRCKLSAIEQSTAQKKLQVVKKGLQDRAQTLMKQVESLKRQLQQKSYLSTKIDEISEINKQIKQENRYLRKHLKQLEDQKQKFKNKEKELTEQLLNSREKCGQLQIRIEELLLQQAAERKQLQEFSYRQSGPDSNLYRIKDSLSFLENESNIMLNSTIREPLQNSSSYQIHTIPELSNEESIFDALKQNKSMIMNIQKSNRQTAKLSSNKQKSELIEQIESSYKQQISVLVNAILLLQENLSQARNFSIGNNPSMTESRMKKFKKKVRGLLSVPEF